VISGTGRACPGSRSGLNGCGTALRIFCDKIINQKFQFIDFEFINAFQHRACWGAQAPARPFFRRIFETGGNYGDTADFAILCIDLSRDAGSPRSHRIGICHHRCNYRGDGSNWFRQPQWRTVQPVQHYRRRPLIRSVRYTTWRDDAGRTNGHGCHNRQQNNAYKAIAATTNMVRSIMARPPAALPICPVARHNPRQRFPGSAILQ
jgi:hypothetical protein